MAKKRPPIRSKGWRPPRRKPAPQATCRECGRVLVAVRLSKSPYGTKTALQCEDRCNGACPDCGIQSSFFRMEGHTKIFSCRQCGSSFESPNPALVRDELEKIRQREMHQKAVAERQERERNALLRRLDGQKSGSKCRGCRQRVGASVVLEATSDPLVWSRFEVPYCKTCRWTGDKVFVGQVRKSEVEISPALPESNCAACGYPIRPNGQCGCS